MSAKIPEDINLHIAQIEKWLEQNVLVYREVQTVTLYGFQMNWEQYTGQFLVKFDEQPCPMGFRFSIGGQANGQMHVQPPIFHSPLGAPASYQAIEVGFNVMQAIQDALETIFPRILPLGLNKETGRVITMLDPFEDRISDKTALEAARDKLSAPDFEIFVRV